MGAAKVNEAAVVAVGMVSVCDKERRDPQAERGAGRTAKRIAAVRGECVEDGRHRDCMHQRWPSDPRFVIVCVCVCVCLVCALCVPCVCFVCVNVCVCLGPLSLRGHPRHPTPLSFFSHLSLSLLSLSQRRNVLLLPPLSPHLPHLLRGRRSHRPSRGRTASLASTRAPTPPQRSTRQPQRGEKGRASPPVSAVCLFGIGRTENEAGGRHSAAEGERGGRSSAECSGGRRWDRGRG